MATNYVIADMQEIAPIACPCGQTRRAFVDDTERTASFHIVDSDGDAKSHFHRRTTEIYYILEGEGQLELDDDCVDVKPGMSILIKPGCRHRIIGKMKFVNVPIPAFDPEDEWFD